MMVVGGCLTRGWFESADSTDCLFWFIPLYGDSPEFSPCYLASGFTLGFVALEQPFCFINVFSDAIAEVCPVKLRLVPSARFTITLRSPTMAFARSSVPFNSSVV